MTVHYEEGTQLEQLRGLEEIDVTNWAEDDEALKQIFEEKASCTDSQIEGWISSGNISLRTSDQASTAVVIKLNSGDGAVRFFKEDIDLGARQTHPTMKEKVMMVFLEPGHSFWFIRNASIKYITHKPKES